MIGILIIYQLYLNKKISDGSREYFLVNNTCNQGWLITQNIFVRICISHNANYLNLDRLGYSFQAADTNQENCKQRIP